MTLADAVQAAPAFLDAEHLVRTYGLIGLLVIVFAETGLLLGFFLPGDSLLFIAGFAAAGNLGGLDQSIGVVCIAVTAAAVLGAQVGHYLGWKGGPVLFDRPESRLFKPSNVQKAEHAFERFGPAKAVVLARFIPVVRTFMNPVAGVLEMRPREFLVWNLVGGVLWGTGITLLGYFLGNVDVVRTHLELFVLGVVALSLLPIAVELLRKRSQASPRSSSENA
ncbi:MAG: VTT domain-containing protein [Actinobacteria bacterium]|nr:VTT domain-containing protein [Actinomycetota bacterium]